MSLSSGQGVPSIRVSDRCTTRLTHTLNHVMQIDTIDVHVANLHECLCIDPSCQSQHTRQDDPPTPTTTPMCAIVCIGKIVPVPPVDPKAVQHKSCGDEHNTRP